MHFSKCDAKVRLFSIPAKFLRKKIVKRGNFPLRKVSRIFVHGYLRCEVCICFIADYEWVLRDAFGAFTMSDII